MKAKPKGAKVATKRETPKPRDEFDKLNHELLKLGRALHDDRIPAKDQKRRASEVRKAIKNLRKPRHSRRRSFAIENGAESAPFFTKLSGTAFSENLRKRMSRGEGTR